MRPLKLALALCVFVCGMLAAPAQTPAAPNAAAPSLNSNYARDPNQALDQNYTDHIRKYTTDPSFISPLVDYLPASKSVPTPAKVLGDVSEIGRASCRERV